MKLDTSIFYTDNLEKTIDFYQKKLNLKLEAKQGEMYASFVLEDQARLGIKKATEEREKPGYQTIILEVENIEDLYNKFKESVEIYKELSTQSWGKNFAILDPDKNKIEFVERPLQHTHR
jgi:predicted enzyme related to lactoylglutathione lyase